MEIKLAREMGMCFGVKMTLDQIAEAGQAPSLIGEVHEHPAQAKRTGHADE